MLLSREDTFCLRWGGALYLEMWMPFHDKDRSLFISRNVRVRVLPQPAKNKKMCPPAL
jgi:hypothetical protein